MLGRKSQRRQQEPEAGRQAKINVRADRLYDTILFWLQAMEQFHSLRNAPRRPFGTTGCTQGNGTHWHTVRLLPTFNNAHTVACTAPRDYWPDDVLQARVIQRLREAGYTVSDPVHHSCGCAVFTAQLKRLAGQR
jgi:hypothetical protein